MGSCARQRGERVHERSVYKDTASGRAARALRNAHSQISVQHATCCSRRSRRSAAMLWARAAVLATRRPASVERRVHGMPVYTFACSGGATVAAGELLVAPASAPPQPPTVEREPRSRSCGGRRGAWGADLFFSTFKCPDRGVTLPYTPYPPVHAGTARGPVRATWGPQAGSQVARAMMTSGDHTQVTRGARRADHTACIVSSFIHSAFLSTHHPRSSLVIHAHQFHRTPHSSNRPSMVRPPSASPISTHRPSPISEVVTRAPR